MIPNPHFLEASDIVKRTVFTISLYALASDNCCFLAILGNSDWHGNKCWNRLDDWEFKNNLALYRYDCAELIKPLLRL